MLIYVIVFLISSFFILYAKKYYKRYKYGIKENCYSQSKILDYRLKYYICFIFAFISLFFISAFRYDVGTDYMYTYYPNFYSILAGEKQYSEIGFYLLNRFIQVFTDNSVWLFIITSFIFVYCLLKSVVKYSYKPLLSMVVIFLSCIYFVSLNNVRQSIAAIIMLLAYDALYYKKTIKYLAYILLASIFHYSSVIMLLAYVFMNIKFIRKHFIAVTTTITLAIPVIANIAIAIIMKTKYSYFLTSHFNNGQVTIVNILYGLLLFLITLLILRKSIKTERESYILLCSQYFYFLISMLSIFISASELISRLAFYFLLFQIILIPYLVVKQKNWYSKLFIVLMYIGMYGMYFYYYIIIQGYHGILPYQFIFNV